MMRSQWGCFKETLLHLIKQSQENIETRLNWILDELKKTCVDLIFPKNKWRESWFLFFTTCTPNMMQKQESTATSIMLVVFHWILHEPKVKWTQFCHFWVVCCFTVALWKLLTVKVKMLNLASLLLFYQMDCNPLPSVEASVSLCFLDADVFQWKSA